MIIHQENKTTHITVHESGEITIAVHDKYGRKSVRLDSEQISGVEKILSGYSPEDCDFEWSEE